MKIKIKTEARFVLSVVLSLAFAPAPFPKPDAGKEDLQKLQGEWAERFADSAIVKW